MLYITAIVLAVLLVYLITCQLQFGQHGGSNQSACNNKWHVEDSVTRLQGQVWVQHDAPLQSRLHLFNDVISEQRNKTMQSAIPVSNLQPSVQYLYYDEATYLRRLARNIPSIVTVFLQLIGAPVDNSWDSR